MLFEVEGIQGTGLNCFLGGCLVSPKSPDHMLIIPSPH